MVELTYLPSNLIKNVVREVELTHWPGMPGKPVGKLPAIERGPVVALDAASSITHHLVQPLGEMFIITQGPNGCWVHRPFLTVAVRG
mgnify:CR=1 FL=1